jgi:hypothetical protein
MLLDGAGEGHILAHVVSANAAPRPQGAYSAREDET